GPVVRLAAVDLPPGLNPAQRGCRRAPAVGERGRYARTTPSAPSNSRSAARQAAQAKARTTDETSRLGSHRIDPGASERSPLSREKELLCLPQILPAGSCRPKESCHRPPGSLSGRNVGSTVVRGGSLAAKARTGGPG